MVGTEEFLLQEAQFDLGQDTNVSHAVWHGQNKKTSATILVFVFV